MTRTPRLRLNWRGFTIIEIMIVLAIAGLILLIVFLAIPALRRSSNNYGVKNYSGQVYAALSNYYGEHGHYPGASGNNPLSPSNRLEICNFLTDLPQVPPGSSCTLDTASSTFNGNTENANCMIVQGPSYSVCYQDWTTVNHAYVGSFSEISIMLAHWCNVPPHNDNTGNPVTGNDSLTQRFAIWTQLQGTHGTYCIDNFPN